MCLGHNYSEIMALELLGQDHKASFTKLFRYMHAILASNHGSTVSLEKDWLGGGVNPHFKFFFVFFDACRFFKVVGSS